MRLLWICNNGKGRINSEAYWLQDELSRQTTLYSIGGGQDDRVLTGDVRPIVKRFDPDVILIYEALNTISFAEHRPRWKFLDEVDVPKAVIWGDPHRKFQLARVKWIKKNKINMSFFWFDTVYNDGREKDWFRERIIKQFGEYHPIGMKGYRELMPNHLMYWMPWSVNTRIFHPRGEREYDLCFMGRISGLRHAMNKRLVKNPKHNWKVFYNRPPPKYSLNKTTEELTRRGWLWKDTWAKAIANAKLWPFSMGPYRCMVIKAYESMACGTVPIADLPCDHEALHVVPDWNFVETSRYQPFDFMEKIAYWLKHDDRRQEVSKNAVDTIQKYHTTEIRVKQYLNHLRELL